jgi:CDP-6-deoxy-D-xylo-4-hexulose-3-dehydrase
MNNIKWPLNVNNFTLLDKLKICKFILNPNSRWTQDKLVSEFEQKMATFVNQKYAVFVSSGSTANTLIAMYLKDTASSNKNVIVFPSTTWITSVSPFIREGFDPAFIDVSLNDLCMDLDKLEKYLQSNYDKVACVFVTSLLGYVPDINRLKSIETRYGVKIMMDNCENTLGSYDGENVSHYFTSTTSTYFGHQLQSIEGGFIFTSNQDEYEYFIMGRNHGMVRSLSSNQEKYKNVDVDSRFDFAFLGSNFRNTNLNAFIGMLDFDRVDEYIKNRIKIYDLYYNLLNRDKFILPKNFSDRQHVAFTLPVICKNRSDKDILLKLCDSLSIETRPIISGNLLRQTCFKSYGDYSKFQNSEFLHNNGFYLGLHNKVSTSDVVDLTYKLNR